MELAYPPFEMTDILGNPSGISVDFAKSLAEGLGKDLEIKNIAFDGLIPALKTGKIDIIISSMTITEERKKSISFSDPYSKSYLALLINKDSDVDDISDLNQKGKKIAVKRGTTGHIYANENLQNAEIMVFDKEHACVLEVIQGKADAFTYDQMTIFKNWQKNRDKTRAILKPFQKDFEYWGIGIRKNNKELLEKVNGFIKKFKEEKRFEPLAEKYLAEIKEEYEKRNIEFFF
jgi:polar amino acid transport system substrate-binding protein